MRTMAALLADGWKPPKTFASGHSSSSSRSVKKNSSEYKGFKNPLDKEGKPYRCFNCNSEYHMSDKCKKKMEESENEEEKVALSNMVRDRKEEGIALSQVLAKKSVTEFNMVCCDADSRNEMTGNEDGDVSDMVFSDLFARIYSAKCSVSSKVSHEDSEMVFVSHNEQELVTMVEEAGSRGVLDTGCSRSVAGFMWVHNYAKLISSTFAKTLKVHASTKVYHFGSGEKRPSQGKLSLPVIIGDKKLTITIEVVDADIPLLVGSNSMKLAKTVMSFVDNTATFFDEKVNMVETGTGHFCIDLFDPLIETHVNDVRELGQMKKKGKQSRDRPPSFENLSS